MYQSHKIFVREDMKMAGLIKENPQLLLLLEHFEIDFVVNDKTIAQLCADYSISVQLFLLFANIYNGFNPDSKIVASPNDVLTIIRFLKNSHQYYKTDKYPEIIGYIKELQNRTGNEAVKLIERFFADYFNEVLEHLKYEDEVAFPYFSNLVQTMHLQQGKMFSVSQYRDHHSDIETKLADLKNLLLKHIRIEKEFALRRKLFFSLLELEFDLQIHAQIEEKVLLPLVAELEKSILNG